MKTHREVERTYAAAPGASLPDLSALPGIAAIGDPADLDLAAVYFDTPDLALLRARVSLRRRTGGDDEGWHLKLPAGTGRDELHLPLEAAGQAPPPELLERARGWTRGAPVVAVATVATVRTERALRAPDGRVLALLADDQVIGADLESGRSVAWREWELELVDGDESLLRAADGLMAGGGIPVSDVPRKILHVLGERLGEPRLLPQVGPELPAGNLLQRRLAEQVAELLRRDGQVRAGSAEGVHQARVASRRLRCALATYRPLVDRAVTDPVRAELQWLGRALADARDAKVVRERLAALLDEEPPDLVDSSARARLASTYDERGRIAGAHAREVLDSERYFALLDTLERLVDDPPWTDLAARPADDVLRGRVRRDWKRLRRSIAEAADAPDRDRALHQARKDAKRFRYAAEVLQPVWGKDARRLARSAKRLTSHLGARQDTVVSREHLEEIAGAAEAAAEGAFTWGRLHAREQGRAERLDRDLDDLWSDMSRKKLRAWLG